MSHMSLTLVLLTNTYEGQNVYYNKLEVVRHGLSYFEIVLFLSVLHMVRTFGKNLNSYPTIMIIM